MQAIGHTGDMKISAVIPVYNGQQYLEGAILSVVRQTCPPHEIIIVDDGSTDRSPAIIEKLAQDYPLRYFHQENRGQSAARNLGVAVSTGDLIAFLDQDDLWYPHHLEELVKPFQAPSYPELGWAYGNVDQIGPQGELLRLGVLSATPGPHPKRSIFECLAADMYVIPSATLVSRKAFLEVGGFDERLSGYEDDDLFVRIFSKGYGNVYIDKSLGQWRLHGGSCSWSRRMAASRMLYAKKLLDTYRDNQELGLFYHNNFILPRFLNIIISELYRANNCNNVEYLNILRKDLQSLVPYMNKTNRFKTMIIVSLIISPRRQSLFGPLLKLYWLLEKLLRTLRLAYA